MCVCVRCVCRCCVSACLIDLCSFSCAHARSYDDEWRVAWSVGRVVRVLCVSDQIVTRSAASRSETRRVWRVAAKAESHKLAAAEDSRTGASAASGALGLSVLLVVCPSNSLTHPRQTHRGRRSRAVTRPLARSPPAALSFSRARIACSIRRRRLETPAESESFRC